MFLHVLISFHVDVQSGRCVHVVRCVRGNGQKDEKQEVADGPDGLGPRLGRRYDWRRGVFRSVPHGGRQVSPPGAQRADQLF